MATTLQLVNRLRKKMQEETITALGDDRSAILLDHLNEAKNDLLEGYTWSFDERTDGELLTMPSLTGQIVVPQNGSTGIGTTTALASVVGQSAVARLVVPLDENFGDTAFRIVSVTDQGALRVFTMNIAWPGTTNLIDGAADIVFDEYVLPDTVRAVTSVRHQESDLQVIETDRDIGMDTWAARPHANQSEIPTFAFVGKRVRATYNTAVAATDVSGISIKFDPTPGAQSLLFSYSYVYRHPDLSETQGLDGVDRPVEDMIVRLAEGRAQMSGLGGGDIELGAAIETEVFNRAQALKGNSRRDPMRRYVLGPTIAGSRPSVYGFGRFPRNFGSL